MKYVITNDIQSFFNKYKIYILVFLFTIITSVIIQKIIGIPLEESLFLDALGFRTNLDYGLMPFLLFILNCGAHIFVVVQIFNNDIKNGLENIFLRMSLNKWINIKCFSILLLNTLLTFLLYICLIIVFLINGVVLASTIKYVLINIVFFSLIEYLFLLIYIISKRFKWLIPIFVILFLLFSGFVLVDVNTIFNNKVLFIVGIIVIITFINIVIRKNIIQIFE